MNLHAINEEANRIAKKALKDYPEVKSELVDLDTRCGSIYVGEDFVAIKKSNAQRFEYYGGFEYVDKENRLECGEYVFYSSEDERVQAVIDIFEDKEDDDDED